jgi:hypothetical protein
VYRASVVKVMIATPSDVAKPRQIIREVIHEWNVVHSETTNLVLLPVGWDTHSYPSLAGRPQEVLNEQIVKGCDLLVAVFWTRLGSPTGEAPSGSVEEIREHRAAGKPAMLYFSNEPVHPASVDEAQIRAVREFRAECEREGLVETYESATEFRDKFARQLASIVRDQFSNLAPGDDEAGVREFLEALQGGATRGTSVEDTLNAAAKELLIEAATDSDGTVLRIGSQSGLSISTNGRSFVEGDNARSQAKWEGAIRALADADLIRDRGYKGEVFGVTDRGFEVADRLKN